MESKIHYNLKKSKRVKRMRIAVYCDGKVVVTAPIGIEQLFIEKFIAQKSHWIIDKLNYFKSFSCATIKKPSKKDYEKNKNQALALIEKRINYFNKIYGFEFNKINIKNQKTRWGSCSKKGNLNFNYKIILIEEKLADYIIVHELCHLKEFNHSQKFWNLVAKTIPEYLRIRNELKGANLRKKTSL